MITNPVRKHLPHLDGIRGWAILLVLLYHCFDKLKLTVFCWVGVDLFFVLSGFLITGILLNAKDKKFYFRNFITRRSLRIFPLYYLFIVVFFFIVPALQPKALGDISYYREHTGWFALYLQNWLYSLEGFPKSFMFHHLWSLAIEEQFYLLWPFMVYILSVKNLIRVSVLLIVFANVFRLYGGPVTGLQFPFEYMNTFSRMDALLLGALVSVLYTNHPQWLQKLLKPAFFTSVFLLLVYMATVRNLNFWKYQPAYTLIDLLFASLIGLSMLENKWGNALRGFFSRKSYRLLGKYSYGLYIYHYPIFLALMIHLFPLLKEKVHYAAGAELLVGFVSLLITGVLSYFSFHYFEMPFLKLKDRFSK